MNIGAKEINDWHKASPNNWDMIGYHIVIRRNYGELGGLIEFGRPLDKAGAHVKGYNSKSIGICMVGGKDEGSKSENNFTKDQFEALEKVLKFFTSIFPKAIVQGHRDFPNVFKTCPCFDVKEWWLKQGVYSIWNKLFRF